MSGVLARPVGDPGVGPGGYGGRRMQALFTHHAFVDLETTGLDPGVDEVIELGVLFVEQGQVVRRREQLFSSRAPLPLTIRRITGLTDEDLRGRDAFAAYAGELR